MISLLDSSTDLFTRALLGKEKIGHYLNYFLTRFCAFLPNGLQEI